MAKTHRLSWKLAWRGEPLAHAYIIKRGRPSTTSLCGLGFEIGHGKERCAACERSYAHRT